jgi:hypothetical protein
MNVGNRVLWSIIGLLLLAAGVLGVLANRGWLGFSRDESMLTANGAQPWRDWPGWLIASVIVAGLLVALLGLMIVRAELRARGGAPMADLALREPAAPPDLTVEPAPAGKTVISTSALKQSLTRDLERARQVRDAAVNIVGPHGRPQLLVRLSVTQDAELAPLAEHVDRAVARFARTSGLAPEVAEVTVKVADRQPERVR